MLRYSIADELGQKIGSQDIFRECNQLQWPSMRRLYYVAAYIDKIAAIVTVVFLL